MRLGPKISLFSFVIPLLMVFFIVFFGLATMNRVIYDLNYKLILNEMNDIKTTIANEHQTLKKAGVDAFPHYIELAKKEFLSFLDQGRFNLSGQLYILDTVNDSILNKKGDPGLDYPLIERKLFTEISGETQLTWMKEKYFVSYAKIPYWNWIIILTVSSDELFRERSTYLKLIIPLFLISLVFGFSLFYILFKNVLIRIEDSLECLKKVEAGNLNTQINIKPSNDEIEQIQRAINQMITSLKENYDGLENIVEKRTVELKEEIEAVESARSEISYLNKYLKNIIDSMPTILIGINRDLSINTWNPEAEKISKLNERDVLGKKIFDLVNGKGHRELQLMELINSGLSFTSNQTKVHIGQSPAFYADISYFPLKESRNEMGIFQIQDISEKYRLEELMMQSEKMLTVGGLAAGMAHEINNPLAGMMHTVQNISRRLSADLPVNSAIAEECGIKINDLENYTRKRHIPEMIQSILDSGQHAAEIVEGMISFSSGDVITSKLHKVDLLLDNAFKQIALDYDLGKIKVIKNYENNLPEIPCEDDKIVQVFYNILHNAVQAVKMTNYEPTITMNIQKEKDEIIIEINDNGPGMEKSVRKRVFEPFFSTKEINEGTGLGLSVSYFIIREHHKGTLRVESTMGEGTTFIISLPIERVKH